MGGLGLGVWRDWFWCGGTRGRGEGRGRFWGVGMGRVAGVCAGWGEGEEEGMLVGEGVRVRFSEEGWARRGV